MKNKTLFAVVVSTCVLAGQSFAQQTTVAFDSGSQLLYSNIAKTTLVTGGTAAPGDGAVLQLGYFTSSSIGKEFLGAFVPLSGEGAGTTFTTTTVGDDPTQGAGAGTFALSLNFNAVNDLAVTLPPAGTILAVRFYDGTSIAASTGYNTVTSDAANWQFKSPGIPSVNVGFSLDDGNLIFEDSANPFVTSISTVPEPSTYVEFAVGIIGLGILYKRRHTVA